jgi:hypothetical protein
VSAYWIEPPHFTCANCGKLEKGAYLSAGEILFGGFVGPQGWLKRSNEPEWVCSVRCAKYRNIAREKSGG